MIVIPRNERGTRLGERVNLVSIGLNKWAFVFLHSYGLNAANFLILIMRKLSYSQE